VWISEEQYYLDMAKALLRGFLRGREERNKKKRGIKECIILPLNFGHRAGTDTRS